MMRHFALERNLLGFVMNSVNSRRFADALSCTRLALKASSVVLVLYGISILFLSPFRFKIEDRSASSILNLEFSLPGEVELGKNVDFSSHSLFYYPKTEVAGAGPGLDEILRPFHLIGIIQGEKPEALLRNDLNQQTYFARAGENFEKFRVKEIHSSSIQVEFENQIKEIYLEEGIS